MSDFEIIDAAEVPPAELRAVMSVAFDKPRPSDWFEWKHRDGPWGPSSGLVARDAEGAVGVRMLLPWQLQVAGRSIRAWRAVEASTVPRAQGQAIFSRLNRALMDQLLVDEPTLIFSTPNANSRNGYAKLGWSLFRGVEHRFAPVLVRRLKAGLASDQVLEAYSASNSGRITTAWSTESLRWRTDPRCGHEYEARRLRSGDHPNGIVFRRASVRGARILLPLKVWGSERERRVLLGAVCLENRTPLVLRPVTATGRAHRFSELAVYPCGPWADLSLDPTSARSWSLDFTDTEGVL